ncbi:hypothetical protein [Mesorhizobium sp. M0847]
MTALDLMEADFCDDVETADDERCPDTYGETVMWGEDLKSQEVLAGS